MNGSTLTRCSLAGRAASLCALLLVITTFTAQGAYVDGQICVTLEPGYGIEEVNGRWGTTTLIALPEANLYLVFIAGVGNLEEFAESMAGDSAVEVAEVNYLYETPEAVRQMVVGAISAGWEDYEDQEITERIGLDEALTYARGEGITVAVLDTGVDPNHPALVGHISPRGFDYVDNDGQPWEESNGIDDDEDGLTDEGFGHGTMVAGIVRLVAPDATILPIRVLNDEGLGDIFQIARAVIFSVLMGADVIHMSLGAPVDVAILTKQFELADALGVLTVAAAGNEDREEPPYFPASDAHVFMITALDSCDVKAEFADYHPDVDVSAPGVGVLSAYPDGEWAIGSGCSFAAPFVSGEVALMLSLEPHLTRAEVRLRMRQAVDPIYQIPGNEPYVGKLGTGRIFLPLALQGMPASAGEHLIPRSGLSLVAEPNPSSGSMRLRLTAPGPSAQRHEVMILDASGRLVRTLELSSADGVRWDGDDAAGHPVPTGTYFARLPDRRAPILPLVLVR